MVSIRPSLVTLSLAATLVLGCSNDPNMFTPDLSRPAEAVDMATPLQHGCGTKGSVRQLSNLTGQHAYPRVAVNGAGYVSTWVSGLAGSPPTFRIDATLIDPQGNKLGPNLPMSDQPIAASDPPSVIPIVGGTTIAWTRLAGAATDIVITTVDNTGQKLDSVGNPCDPADAACGILPVTTSGTARSPFLERPYNDQHISGPTQNQLGLVFIDTRNYPCISQPCAISNDVFWKRIQTNGAELIFEKQLTTMQNERYASPRMAFDGFHQGVVWRDITLATSDALYFSTVDNLGQLSSAVQKIGSVSGNAAPSTPDVVWSGVDYALVSASGTDSTAAILLQRQSPNGTSTLPPKGVTFGGSSCTPAIAFDGANYGIAYQVNCGAPGSDIAFVRVNPNGTRLALDGTSCGDSVDPSCGVLMLTSNVRESSTNPEMVYGGDASFAVVWMQGEAGPNLQPGVALDVFMQRVVCD